MPPGDFPPPKVPDGAALTHLALNNTQVYLLQYEPILTFILR
jgi:hypothetical protein